MQGSEGIMVDKLMYTPNDDIQNYPLYKSQLVVEMFEHLN